MTEAELKRKLASIEALLHGATTDGERTAAQTVFERLKQKGATEKTEDFQFSIQDPWGRRLFIAMCRKAGLTPFRRHGQRTTTLMVHGTRSFVIDGLWVQFQEADQTLRQFLDEVTERVIRETLGEAEAEARERPALPKGG